MRDPAGHVYELVHGDIVGRLLSAALPLDDPRISEAHAMVSLREQELRLISLRGVFAVDGTPSRQVTLREGLAIQLAHGVTIHVDAVSLPEAVLGIEGPRLPRQVLPPVASIVPAPGERGLLLTRGWVEGAGAFLWSASDDSWKVRVPGTPDRPLTPGITFDVAGQTLRAVAIPLAAAGQHPTGAVGRIDAPLQIVARFDSVQIFREGDEALRLSGILARLVSELVALDGPAHWTVVARELWSADEDDFVLRQRFDVNLSRLRRQLRAARLRPDLVRTDGTGFVELALSPHDTVRDAT